jgi:hypothetical protein
MTLNQRGKSQLLQTFKGLLKLQRFFCRYALFHFLPAAFASSKETSLLFLHSLCCYMSQVYTSIPSRSYLQDYRGEVHSSNAEAEGRASAHVQSTALKSLTSCNTSMLYASKPLAATNASLQPSSTAAPERKITGVEESASAPCVRIFWDADTIPFYKPVYAAILKQLCCSGVCSCSQEKTAELLLCVVNLCLFLCIMVAHVHVYLFLTMFLMDVES